MTTVSLVFAAIAALVHVYIFVLESVLWTSDGTIRKFGITRVQAEQTKQLAFNQGFYNLFLAIIAAAGIVFLLLQQPPVGRALLAAGLGSMVAAGLVLAISDPTRLRAAITQLATPSIALVLLFAA
jgi:putative membrane protein